MERIKKEEERNDRNREEGKGKATEKGVKKAYMSMRKQQGRN